ncbi:MAG TPA: holo-ACP synthase [Spirochaetia bacterium]|nr:holo-ACP synthase [Spirochaetia bacterium]
MILGIGLDAVNIERLKKWENYPHIFERFFHPQELETARNRGSMAIHSLAARFAAKEAFGKALGTGLTGFSLKECSVVNNRHGKPELLLYGKAEEAFTSFGGKRALVALTHEHDYAIAVVVIEGE